MIWLRGNRRVRMYFILFVGLALFFGFMLGKTWALKFSYTEIIPPGWGIANANGINDSGGVAGFGVSGFSVSSINVPLYKSLKENNNE